MKTAQYINWELLYVYVFPEMSSFSGNHVFTEFEVVFDTSLHVEIQATDACLYWMDFVVYKYEVQHVGLTAHAYDNLGFSFTNLSWSMFSR